MTEHETTFPTRTGQFFEALINLRNAGISWGKALRSIELNRPGSHEDARDAKDGMEELDAALALMCQETGSPHHWHRPRRPLREIRGGLLQAICCGCKLRAWVRLDDAGPECKTERQAFTPGVVFIPMPAEKQDPPDLPVDPAVDFGEPGPQPPSEADDLDGFVPLGDALNL